MEKQSYKPGSVSFRMMTIYLDLGSLLSSSGRTRDPDGQSVDRNPVSAWPCFGWGLPGRKVTLTPVSSYLAVAPLPAKLLRRLTFLWHFPESCLYRVLPGTLPCEARTFLVERIFRGHPLCSS